MNATNRWKFSQQCGQKKLDLKYPGKSRLIELSFARYVIVRMKILEMKNFF